MKGEIHINFHVLSYLSHLHIFLLKIIVKICKMNTVFLIYFENIFSSTLIGELDIM